MRTPAMSFKFSSIEEKVELYDKLMKKMDGDYTNLLAPAIAKAKAIEEQAEKEYAPAYLHPPIKPLLIFPANCQNRRILQAILLRSGCQAGLPGHR